jgi:hypothetical protein
MDEYELDRRFQGDPLCRGQLLHPRPARLPSSIVGIELDVPVTGACHDRPTYTRPPRTAEQRRSWSEPNFPAWVELRGREGWPGERTAEAVTAGVGG